MTVAKAGVLSELKYYCVDDVDESTIDDSPLSGPELGRRINQGHDLLKHALNQLDESELKLKESTRSIEQKLKGIRLAKECIEHFRANCNRNLSSFQSCAGFSEENVQNSNKHLEKVGLRVNSNGIYFADGNVSSFNVTACNS
jgi:hypothetical protein